MTDGLSNTVSVVEADSPVLWTRPADLPFDGGNPSQRVKGVGSKHPGGFNALMADGSVRFLKATVSPAVLRALVTRSGGEIINPTAF